MAWGRWAWAVGACMVVGCAMGAPTTDDDASPQGDATSDVATDAGATVCNGVPTNTKTDPANCGACGHACAPSATCTYGTCQCPNGGTDCNGTCFDLKNDVTNCGKCGNACGASSSDAGLAGGGTWACVSSVCTVECPGDGGVTSCTNGCFDTTSDKAHCGNCGTDCGQESCCGSSCTDTTMDNANCGKCGTACTSTQSCTNSHCCTTGQTYCTSACTNTATDTKNCGACGTACKTGETCNNSKCCAAPTQGTCAHSLCDGTTLTPLKKACDPNGCVTKVCTADSFCCNTYWDSACVSEVATYCPPYSCTGC